MNPLNDMHDALISINSILQKRKHTSEEICTNTNVRTSELKSTADANENNHNQLHYELLTEENFHRAHLCNRSIDELPNISVHDIRRLKLIDVYTMQDLLGRFLIHDTPEEFCIFLINTFQLSEKTASIITHLFHQWTKYNLDGTTIDS